MSWTGLALAMTAFVGSHYLPGRGGLRARMIGAVGRRAYFGVYGLVSLAVLAWLIAAAGAAPYVELWPQAPWTRWVPNLAMPLAAMLAAVGIGASNPFTLGGRRGAAFDPERPGVAAVMRHPLLGALALWAGAHIVPNGDLAHVIVFGTFLAMAIAAMPAFDRRARHLLGPDASRAFFASTAALSLSPLRDARWRRANLAGLARRAAIGLATWLAALLLHPVVIGVSPLPS